MLEKKAADILRAQTGLPVVCSSELFSGLSSLERAASAVLNAGLLPITQDFIAAVTRAFRARGIDAEILIVRSDSSLMGLQYSAEHAVETLLSGPAASALGGSTLTGREDAVVVDIGGTTTDVALIEHGAPLLSEGGVRVGKWKTMVRGLFSHLVRARRRQRHPLGPQRSAVHRSGPRHPACACSRTSIRTFYPCCAVRCAPYRRTRCRCTNSSPSPARTGSTSCMTRPTAACAARSKSGPLSLQQAADAVGVDKYTLHTGLPEKAGVILRAGLTPTDVMHVRGDYTRYSVEAARLAVQFAANSLRLLPEEFCTRIYDEVSRAVFYGVSQMLLEHASPYYRRHGLDDGMRELLRLQWENRDAGGDGLLHYAFRATAALIGIGGPVHLFLPEAAARSAPPVSCPTARPRPTPSVRDRAHVRRRTRRGAAARPVAGRQRAGRLGGAVRRPAAALLCR